MHSGDLHTARHAAPHYVSAPSGGEIVPACDTRNRTMRNILFAAAAIASLIGPAAMADS